MFSRARELWYALAAIAVATAIYAVAYRQAGALPEADGLIGHGIGIAGITLMLTTEVAYSIRKQVTTAEWGSMAGWLRFHMVTGLVGPYLALLHTALAFRGLAGVTMLTAGVVVASGLVGRYLYTTVPRSVEGAGDSAGPPRLGARILVGERHALATWHTVHVSLTWVLFALAFVHMFAALYYATLQRF